jgi:hypothetical protein
MTSERRATPSRVLDILLLGANYGLLPAVRCALAGHRVTVVCRPDEQAALASQGVDLDIGRRDGRPGKHIGLPAAPGRAKARDCLGLLDPAAAEPSDFDLVILAMAEPQYAVPELASLVARIGAADCPVISMMNMVPSSYLRRLGGINVERLDHVYASAAVWKTLDPRRITAASPDAQAIRLDPTRPGRLTVTLASNFKIAPFAEAKDQRLLTQLCQDIICAQDGGVAPPMRLIPYDRLFVPLAKWPMLIAGNYRCRRVDGTLTTIAAAVHADLAETQRIYEWVANMLLRAGAAPEDMVPFAKYATAAQSLRLPSSVARGLAAGAVAVERVDRLVAEVAAQQGDYLPELARIVASVDHALDENRQAAARTKSAEGIRK